MVTYRYRQRGWPPGHLLASSISLRTEINIPQVILFEGASPPIGALRGPRIGETLTSPEVPLGAHRGDPCLASSTSVPAGIVADKEECFQVPIDDGRSVVAWEFGGSFTSTRDMRRLTLSKGAGHTAVSPEGADIYDLL